MVVIGLPSNVMWVKDAQSCLTACDPKENSLGQNTGVGSLSLLQGIFPTQGLNPGLPHCRQILYQLNHKGSPNKWNKPYAVFCVGFLSHMIIFFVVSFISLNEFGVHFLLLFLIHCINAPPIFLYIHQEDYEVFPGLCYYDLSWNKHFLKICIYFVSLALRCRTTVPNCNTWDLSSLIKDQIHVPCVGNKGSIREVLL